MFSTLPLPGSRISSSKRKRMPFGAPSINLNLIVDRPDGLIKEGKKSLPRL